MSRLFVQNYIKKHRVVRLSDCPTTWTVATWNAISPTTTSSLSSSAPGTNLTYLCILLFFLYLSLFFDNPFIDFCIYISLCQNIWLIFELKIENFVFAKVRLLPPSTLEAKRSEEASQTFLNDGKVKGSSKKAAKPVENYSKSQRIE